jgi:large subunit ribosomal protein L2
MEEEICRIVWRGKALKGLLFGRKQNAGRNNKGRIVINYRGGGEKKNYRLIDFKRLKINIPGRVCRIERDIHRTALIMLISYYDGTLSYILKPERIKLGDVICATFYKLEGKGLKIGNHLKIGLIPLGYYIHNIELGEGRGGKLVRSQGVAGKIVKRYKNYTVVKLP